MKTFLGIILSVLFSSLAQARIGENVEQCEKRYGPTVERRPAIQATSDKEACVFSKDGVTIVVEYRNGTAWHVSYRLPVPMLDAVLAAIAPDGGWSAPVTIDQVDVRIASTARDQVASVTYPAKNRRDDPANLVVCTRAYSKANRDDYQAKLAGISSVVKEREAAKPLKGF